LVSSLISLILLACVAAAEPQLSEERAVFHTNHGDIVVGFYPTLAPQHVAQILKMIELGVYTDSEIFRVEVGFVAQVENFTMRKNPLPAEIQKQIPKLPAEFSPEPHVRGILSMARFDDPNSAESSFSFVLGNAPHLDNKYTVFGRVLQGFEALSAIERLPVDGGKKPMTPVRISSAEILGKDVVIEVKAPPAGSSMTTYLAVGAMLAMLVGAMFFSGKGSS